MDEEFLREFAGKSELTSALKTVRTAGGGGVHGDEAASGRRRRDPRAGSRAPRGGGSIARRSRGSHPSGGRPASHGVVVASADGDDGDEDATERRRARQSRGARRRRRGGARAVESGTWIPVPVERPGRRAESPSQLSNHAPPGVFNQSPSDLSVRGVLHLSRAPHQSLLGLSRRNTHGGSSFTLAAEDNPTPQSVPPQPSATKVTTGREARVGHGGVTGARVRRT